MIDFIYKIGNVISILYLFIPFYILQSEKTYNISEIIIFGIGGLSYIVWRYEINNKIKK